MVLDEDEKYNKENNVNMKSIKKTTNKEED